MTDLLSAKDKEELCRFIPYKIAFSTGPANWKVEYDEDRLQVVRRNPLAPANVILGIVLGLIPISVLCLMWYYAVQISIVEKVGISICCGMVLLVLIIGLPLVDALMVISNDSFWKGKMRMQVNLQCKEFFFPRENKRYTVDDFSEAVLGCVWGFYTVNMEKCLGMILKTSGGKNRNSCAAQVFVLMHTNDGQWFRHEIASGIVKWHSKYGCSQFDKMIDVLQPLINCEIYFHKYSLEECFNQQHTDEQKSADSNNKVLW